jgi:hypothetical protein
MEYIAFDAHKHYTLASVVRPDGRLVREQRLAHERGAFQQFLARCEPGSPVALETVGNWYWIVDEIEGAGCIPKLVHAQGEAHDGADQQDGSARRPRAQHAATEWDAAHGVDSARRVAGPARAAADAMALVRQRTQLKNRLRHLGQVHPPRPGGDGSLRRPRAPAAAATLRAAPASHLRMPPGNSSTRSKV